MSGSVPGNSQNKKRRKRACSALLEFQKKLQNACGTFQTANEWYEYINELKDLIVQYTDLIPVPVQDRLNSITTLTDPTRDAINKACTLLSRDLKDIIEEFFPDILEEIQAHHGGSEQQPQKPPYQRPEIIAPSAGGTIAAIVIVVLFASPEFDFNIYSDTQHLILKAGESYLLYINVNRIEGNTKNVFLNCDVVPPAPIRCIIDKNRIYPNPSETIKLTITVDKPLTSSHTVVLTGISEGNARTHEFGVYVEPKTIPIAVLAISPKNNEEVSSQIVPFTLKITAENKPVQDAEVSIFLDNRKTHSLVSNSNGLVSGKFTSVSYDEHSWYAKVGKSGYEPSETGHMYFVVSDTDSPLVDITWPSDGKFLNTNIIEIQGTASDKSSGIQNVMISIDNGMYQPVEGISSWSYKTDLSDGPHTVKALVSDNFGRKTESIPVEFTVDTIAPNVSVIFDRNPDHNGYYTSPVAIKWYSPNEENVSCHMMSYSGPDGNTIKLDGSCTDKAGNSSFISTSINYDATPPQTKEVTAQDENGNAVPNGGITYSSQMRFFIGASDTVDVDMDYECILDGQMISCNQIFSISVGQHVMQIAAIDDAGNKDQTPSVFTWTRGSASSIVG